MTVLMVRYQVRDEHVQDVERGARGMISALARQQLDGVRYALCKLADGTTFVGVLEFEDGNDNPLPGIPEAREFQENLKRWVVGGYAPEPVALVGSYRFFE